LNIRGKLGERRSKRGGSSITRRSNRTLGSTELKKAGGKKVEAQNLEDM